MRLVVLVQSCDTNFKNIKMLVFDMDGTLASTTNTELNLFVKLFGKNKNYYKNHFGPPTDKIIYDALNLKNKKESIDLAEKYHKEYIKILNKKIWINKKTIDTIKLLRGYFILGIITSANTISMKKTLKENRKYFDFILCSEDYKKHKPQAESLLKIMKKYKIKNSEIIYIGDNINDIKFGKNAKTKTIGKIDVLYNKKDLEKYNPDKIIKNISELKCLI